MRAVGVTVRRGQVADLQAGYAVAIPRAVGHVQQHHVVALSQRLQHALPDGTGSAGNDDAFPRHTGSLLEMRVAPPAWGEAWHRLYHAADRHEDQVPLPSSAPRPAVGTSGCIERWKTGKQCGQAAVRRGLPAARPTKDRPA